MRFNYKRMLHAAFVRDRFADNNRDDSALPHEKYKFSHLRERREKLVASRCYTRIARKSKSSVRLISRFNPLLRESLKISLKKERELGKNFWLINYFEESSKRRIRTRRRTEPFRLHATNSLTFSRCWKTSRKKFIEYFVLRIIMEPRDKRAARIVVQRSSASR